MWPHRFRAVAVAHRVAKGGVVEEVVERGARDGDRDLGAAVIDKDRVCACLREHDFAAVQDAALDDDVGTGIIGLLRVARVLAGTQHILLFVRRRERHLAKVVDLGELRELDSSRGRGA